MMSSTESKLMFELSDLPVLVIGAVMEAERVDSKLKSSRALMVNVLLVSKRMSDNSLKALNSMLELLPRELREMEEPGKMVLKSMSTLEDNNKKESAARLIEPDPVGFSNSTAPKEKTL